MTIRAAIPLIAAMAFPGLAPAQQVDTRALFDAMRLGEVIEVMRAEGVEYGADLEDELFPGDGGAAWARVVEDIYDADRMEGEIIDGLDRRLSDEALDRLLAFFNSELGRLVTDLEVSARRAMQDDDIEEAAETRAQEMRLDDAPRIGRIDALVAANNLVDMNVAGALNSNFAFYRGLQDGNAFPQPLGEDQMIADVWAQEPEIRADTDQWLYGFLTLAYQPLSDADLDAYIAMSESDTGQALNEALFAAFDQVYSDISLNLGRSAATFMQGEDI